MYRATTFAAHYDHGECPRFSLNESASLQFRKATSAHNDSSPANVYFYHVGCFDALQAPRPLACNPVSLHSLPGCVPGQTDGLVVSSDGTRFAVCDRVTAEIRVYAVPTDGVVASSPTKTAFPCACIAMLFCVIESVELRPFVFVGLTFRNITVHHVFVQGSIRSLRAD